MERAAKVRAMTTTMQCLYGPSNVAVEYFKAMCYDYYYEYFWQLKMVVEKVQKQKILQNNAGM